ncbi:MAG: right-handed parallel beta-helix repeat-containing protein [Clostridia bacterium]|nr:right-handed parallel beta-helix repeat-containing protein [Clostridia bacterium]
MIKVQDWIASIPDSEKHIAYVGEGKSEQRDFLLCGEGWERYKNWTFYLDMAFDLTSVTTHDNRQVVQTTHNSTESREEGGTIVDEVTTKETYSVDNVQTTNHDRTDIAPLVKVTEAEGIRLTWTILRQHTVLPGKLWATLRAVNGEEQRVKKSAIMVFEVDPAICAVSAAVPPISEFKQMEQQMDVLRQQTERAAAEAANSAAEATSSAEYAVDASLTATVAADSCLNSQQKGIDAANAAKQSANRATSSAQQAQTAANTAADQAAIAESAANRSEAHQQSAATHAASAALSNQGALFHLEATHDAVEQCQRSVALCEEYANTFTQSTPSFNRINVRNYGAMGDGVTDDRQAIIDAFTAAKAMLPCEVYFPAGTYGISNGITVEMAYGTGGLLVRGAGRDITTIKYLESYDPNQPGNMWYAIRIWPVGMPDTKPSTEDDYLHDISYTGLTVYDTDPIAHAWNPAKGDPSKEETHGFDLHYCKRASVTDCNIINVGDEAIDICGCHDVVVMNNHLINCPAAGTAGGAISIGDGCKGVVVSGNTLNGSAADTTLEDGTVLTKRNFGIAVESLLAPVSDVVITGNTIKNVRGNGVNIGATNAGSGITNVVVNSNVITDCCSGVYVMDTQYPKSNISVKNNIITGCYGDLSQDGYAIHTGTKTYSLCISGNTLKDIRGANAVKVAAADTAVFTNNLFQDIAACALYCSGDVAVRNCTFLNIGTVDASTQAIAMHKASTYKLVVSDCRLIGIQQKKGIVNVDVVENTEIELVNGGVPVSNCYRIIGCKFNGHIAVARDGAVVQGLTLTDNSTGAHAITITGRGISVIGCNIYQGGKKKAILENDVDTATGNLIANNIVDGTLSTQAMLILADNTGTVCVNNVDLRTVLE